MHVSGRTKALGVNVLRLVDIEGLAELVLQSGKSMPIKGPDDLHIKRSLVNGSQGQEVIGWSLERLDWYKAQGCFTEIIRYQTRLFIPVGNAEVVVERIVVGSC